MARNIWQVFNGVSHIETFWEEEIIFFYRNFLHCFPRNYEILICDGFLLPFFFSHFFYMIDLIWHLSNISSHFNTEFFTYNSYSWQKCHRSSIFLNKSRDSNSGNRKFVSKLVIIGPLGLIFDPLHQIINHFSNDWRFDETLHQIPVCAYPLSSQSGHQHEFYRWIQVFSNNFSRIKDGIQYIIYKVKTKKLNQRDNV